MFTLSPIVQPELVPAVLKLAGGCAVGCYALFEVGRLITQKFVASRGLRPSTAVFLGSCFASMANTLCTSGYALAAFSQMYYSGQPISLTMSAPEALAWSCAITVGYFLADCLTMTFYHADCKREMGTSGMALMWVHHAISLVMWPYAVLTHRSALFVAYYLTTELTNVGQNLFHFCNKCAAPPQLTAVVGVGWLLAFFVVRIVPLPWLVYQYVTLHLQGAVGQTAVETGISLLTIPLPFMLNIYWFKMLVSKGLRMLKGDAKKHI